MDSRNTESDPSAFSICPKSASRRKFSDASVRGEYGLAIGEKLDFSTRKGTLFAVNLAQSESQISNGSQTYRLGPHFYAAIYGRISLIAEWVWYVFVSGYSALNTIGGPIERSGRLRYIDGCTDSLIIPPVLKGDPCLNVLYFPPGIQQTFHTHPSCRIGVVLSGKGTCHHHQSESPLIPGTHFMIPAHGLHRFSTGKNRLVVAAFHPDSDFGPEHDFHPMVNKTLVDGLSARHIPQIRTRVT
ncbi:MAG: AraC family ligand binding domain-containing protein [Verrucomicrobia bacterium]|nr:AraC family ligand binding domain-containing protein [Verrucomicrobiota bacterium]